MMNYLVGDRLLYKHPNIGWQEAIIIGYVDFPTHCGVSEIGWRIKFVKISGTDGSKVEHYLNNQCNIGAWIDNSDNIQLLPNNEQTRSLYLDV